MTTWIVSYATSQGTPAGRLLFEEYGKRPHVTLARTDCRYIARCKLPKVEKGHTASPPSRFPVIGTDHLLTHLAVGSSELFDRV